MGMGLAIRVLLVNNGSSHTHIFKLFLDVTKILYVPIVHLLLIWINLGVSHNKTWTVIYEYGDMEGDISYPLLHLQCRMEFNEIYYILLLCTFYFRFSSESIWGFNVTEHGIWHLWILGHGGTYLFSITHSRQLNGIYWNFHRIFITY